MTPIDPKIKIITIGIQAEMTIGSFSVFPKTDEKSLKKYIITLKIIATII